MLARLGLAAAWTCAGVCCLATVATGGVWGYASWNDLDITTAAHRLGHDAGLCTTVHDDGTDDGPTGLPETASASGSPICLPAPAEVDAAALEDSVAIAGPAWAIAEQEAGGGDVVHAAATTTDEEALSADRQTVIDFIADKVIEVRGIPELTGDEIETATGVSLSSLTDFTEASMRIEVYQELVRRGVDVEALFAATTCSQLSACSVHRNLAGATGEELQRYADEKARDGQTYDDWSAPGFTLPATDGSDISLATYRGRPIVMTLLAGHCTHSLDTLPLLEEIRARYENTDLVVLPIYVNSGSVEDVQAWTSLMDLGFPLAVADGKLADSFDSYLVPSTFLIERDGRIARRLVGFKEADELRAGVESLLAR